MLLYLVIIIKVTIFVNTIKNKVLIKGYKIMELQKVRFAEPFMVTTVRDICEYCSLFEESHEAFNQEFFLGKETVTISHDVTGPWTITVNGYSWSEMIHTYKQLSQTIQNALDRGHKK